MPWNRSGVGKPSVLSSETKRSRQPFGWKTAVAAAGLILATALASSAYGYQQLSTLQVHVLDRFRDGQNNLEAARAVLEKANAERRSELVDEAHEQFLRARGQFDAVKNDLAIGRLDAVASHLPLTGTYARPRIAAAINLAAAGSLLARAGMLACDIEHLILAVPPSPQEQGSKRLLSIARQSQPFLTGIQKDLEVAGEMAHRVDPNALPVSQRDTFQRVIGNISDSLHGIRELQRLLPILSEVLAESGPRLYLVEQVNPGELRAGGGFVGSYSLLSADHGALKVARSGDSKQLPDGVNLVQGQPGYVPPPATMIQFLNRSSWTLRDSNFFADFPANAQAAEQFAERDFGKPVDGVIAIDLYAIAALLQVTGPLQVPTSRLTFSSTNLVNQAVQLDITSLAHKDIMNELASPLVERITTLGPDRWPQLLRVLNQLAAQRHLQVYFNDQNAEALMQRDGWAGTVQHQPPSDYLYALESNFAGNKDNYFLARRYDLTLTRMPVGINHRLVVDLGLDLHEALPYYTFPYRAYFRLHVAGGATNLRSTNLKPDNHANTVTPVGLSLIDGWQEIKPDPATRKGELKVVYEWDTPWAPLNDGAERLYWQKQPGTFADSVTVHWLDGGKTFTRSTDLGEDRLLTLGAGELSIASGSQGSAQLFGLRL